MNTKDNMLPPMKTEVEKIYRANKEKNRFSTEERRAQKELDILMAQAWDGAEGHFEHSFEYEGNKVTVDVRYQQDVRDTVDIKKLYEVLDIETFLNIVTASKSAVEKIAGSNVANMCVGSKLSDWHAKVKEKK